MTSGKSENYYLWCLKILMYLIPFLPLYISSSMVYPYITGKNFAFRIIVELSAVLWVGLFTLNRKYRLQNSTMTLSILAFTFIVGLADVFGVNPYNSFWSNYERMEGYVTILHLALYFIIVKSILRTRNDWMIFFNIFVFVSILVSSYALFQKFAQENIHAIYDTRVYSTIGTPPFLASYLLLSVFLGLILILNTQKTYLKYIYISSTVLNSIVIYFTATRGAIVAVFIGLTFFSLFYIFGKPNTSKETMFKKAVLSVLALVILLTVFLWTFSDKNFIKQDITLSRFYNITSDHAVKTRLRAWEIAWEGIKERPILGWGQENFISAYTVNAVPYSWVSQPQALTDRAHNIALHWLINAGFLGFFSYLVIFGSAFYVILTAIHKKIITKTEAITIITALVVYLAQNLFVFDTVNTYLIFFTLLAYIDNLDYVKRAAYSEINIDLKKMKIKFAGVTLIAFLIFFVAVYFINYKPLRESQLSRQISISFPTGYKPFLNILVDFNKALSFKTFGDADIRLKMAVLSDYMFSRKLLAHEGAMQFIQATAEELEKLVAANRDNLKYWTYLIKFYNKLASYEASFIDKEEIRKRAEAIIKECMRLNPEYRWLYIALADNYILKKDYENAFLIAKKEASLDPQVYKIQSKLALTAILTSREHVVSNTLKNLRKIRMVNMVNNDNRAPLVYINELLTLAQASIEVGDFSHALQFYKEIITISPEEAKYHFDIAKVYLKLDDKVNAIREIKKAAELDPLNFKESAEKIINSILR